MYTLEERDGALYAKEVAVNEWEPHYDVNWYRLVTDYRKFVTWFASEEVARTILGDELYPSTQYPTIWSDKRGWMWIATCANASQRRPDYTELIPIPQPEQKGRQHPLTWHKGHWCKQTARGLVKVEVPA